MLPGLAKGAIVTDVGSVKAGIVDDLEGLVSEAGGYFVGSHPMAGAEKSGVAAARADLFAGAVCVITPTAKTHPAAARKVARFWKAIGGRLLEMSPEEHDALVSRSSHLPHVVAAQLVNLVFGPDQPPNQPALCANGFRDTTRIASGSPEMWRDIALANRENLSVALDGFMSGLRDFQRSLKRRDLPALARFFADAKTRRDGWAGKVRSASPE
jgi:prephenate dehydrogenase